MSIVPATRPRQTEEETRALLAGAKVDLKRFPVALVGVRGYYVAMGTAGANDRGIYDDAIFVVSDHVFAAFNANVDPSVRRPGIATLAQGVHWYMPGIHGLSKPASRRYPAFVQAGMVKVARDGQLGTDEGLFGINIHRGGENTTSSEGCQTLPPNQWDSFRALVVGELHRAGQSRFPYLLTAAKELRK